MANWSKSYLLTVDGAGLTKARTDRDWGQDEVAAKMAEGMNASTVCRWEMGKLQPSPENLWKLVDLFGTTDFVRLNGRAVLTAEEIEVVRKLREG
jgi:ribosome-binding protein aMBF1 (putative translation factor)